MTPKGTRPDGFRPKSVEGLGFIDPADDVPAQDRPIGHGPFGAGPFGQGVEGGGEQGPFGQGPFGPGAFGPGHASGSDRGLDGTWRRPPGRSDDYDDAGTSSVVGELRRKLEHGHPLELLGQASSLAAMIEDAEKPHRFEGPSEDDLPSRAELVEGFLAIDRIETSALLVALSRLLADEVLIRRVDREVARRGHELPPWLARIDRTTVDGAHEMIDVYGDSEDVIVGVRFVDGQQLTGVLLVDHDSGSVAKDGFAVEDGARPSPECFAALTSATTSPCDLWIRQMPLPAPSRRSTTVP